jgi:hypothetical protein
VSQDNLAYNPKKIDTYEYQEQATLIRRILWFCAGADVKLLARCPQSERIKEEGIGGIVLATGGLAFVSGSYAFYTVFSTNTSLQYDQPLDVSAALASIIFGLMWSLVIFNLDRFIVSSVSHGDGTAKITWSEFSGAIPRIVMAIIIGLCLSKPLEIRVMKSEIEAELHIKRMDYRKKEEDKLEKKITEKKAEFETRRGELTEKLEKFVTDRDEKEKGIAKQTDVMNAESGGQRGARGIGPEYRAAEKLRDELRAELLALDQKIDDEKPRIEEEKKRIDDTIDKINEEKEAEMREIEKRSQGLDGLIERITVAHDKYPVPSTILSLLLIIIEVAPIFFKMMLEKGPYEMLVENQKRIVQARYAIEAHSHINTENGAKQIVGETFHQAELINNFEVGNLTVEKTLTSRIQENYQGLMLADIDANPEKYVERRADNQDS